MKWKSTVLLFLITIVIGTWVSLVELKRPTVQEAEKAERDVAFVRHDDATAVILSFPQITASLRHEGEQWRLLTPVASRVDPVIMQRIFQHTQPLRALRALDSTPDAPLDLAAYGLKPPQGKLTIQAGIGRSTTILFGHATAVGGNRYVKTADRSTVYVVPQELFSIVNQPLETYRSRAVVDLDAEHVAGLAVLGPASYTVVKQPPAAEGQEATWQLKAPFEGPADSTSINSIITTLRMLRVERFVADVTDPAAPLSQWGLGPPSTFIAIALDGAPAPLELLVGKPTEDNPDWLYVKRADEPAVVAVSKLEVERILRNPESLRPAPAPASDSTAAEDDAAGAENALDGGQVGQDRQDEQRPPE